MAIPITVSHLSLNVLCSKKEIISMHSVTYWSRLKKDLWSKFHLEPKICTSIQAQSRIRAKVHSWSTIHSVFKILKTARLRQKLTIRALLKAKSVDPKTYSPPSGMEHMFSAGQWELSGHSHEATVTLARRIVRKRSVRVTESSLMVKRNQFCYAIVTMVRVTTIARGKDSKWHIWF